MWISRLFNRDENAIYIRRHWIFNRSSGVVAYGRRYS